MFHMSFTYVLHARPLRICIRTPSSAPIDRSPGGFWDSAKAYINVQATSCYARVSSLVLFKDTSCYARVSSLVLFKDTSCYARVSSLVLSWTLQIPNSSWKNSNSCCEKKKKSEDVSWNLGQIVQNTKNCGFA
jgi:hypothetical protein